MSWVSFIAFFFYSGEGYSCLKYERYLPVKSIITESDSKVYKSAVSIAEKLIGPIQLSLMKLVLSMHTMSPRVQAHFQVAREVLEQGDCKTDTFLTIGSRVACNLDELRKGLDKIKNSKKEEQQDDIYSFDHIYPGSENNTITVILYGEIGSKEYKQFHDYLSKQTESGLVKYVSRHFIRVSSMLKFSFSLLFWRNIHVFILSL